MAPGFELSEALQRCPNLRILDLPIPEQLKGTKPPLENYKLLEEFDEDDFVYPTVADDDAADPITDNHLRNIRHLCAVLPNVRKISTFYKILLGYINTPFAAQLDALTAHEKLVFANSCKLHVEFVGRDSEMKMLIQQLGHYRMQFQRLLDYEHVGEHGLLQIRDFFLAKPEYHFTTTATAMALWLIKRNMLTRNNMPVLALVSKGTQFTRAMQVNLWRRLSLPQLGSTWSSFSVRLPSSSLLTFFFFFFFLFSFLSFFFCPAQIFLPRRVS
jgi:hypothetical protein